MKKEISCEMIEDLIPLCAEDLCSGESKSAVLAHIKVCASCKKLYEHTLNPPEIPANKAMPDETKTFWKVARKITKSRRLNKILGIALCIIAVPVGVLTFGSIAKLEGFPSFETVQQKLEIRKIANAIAKGDFDTYFRLAGADHWDMELSDTDRADISAQDKQLLSALYQQTLYASMKVQHIDTSASYTMSGLTASATVKFADGTDSTTNVTFFFSKEADGRYHLIGSGGSAYAMQGAANRFCTALLWTESRVSQPMNIVEHNFEKQMSQDAERRARWIDQLVHYFAPDYQAQLIESFTAFYGQDHIITEMDISDLHYDAERVQFYYEVTFKAEDSQGGAVLKTRLTESPDMLIPPDLEMCSVYTDGCTDELADALLHFFAY